MGTVPRFESYSPPIPPGKSQGKALTKIFFEVSYSLTEESEFIGEVAFNTKKRHLRYWFGTDWRKVEDFVTLIGLFGSVDEFFDGSCWFPSWNCDIFIGVHR